MEPYEQQPKAGSLMYIAIILPIYMGLFFSTGFLQPPTKIDDLISKNGCLMVGQRKPCDANE